MSSFTTTPSAIGVPLRPQPLRTVDSSSQLLCPFRAGGRLQRMRGLQGQMTNAGVDTATVTAERQPRLYTDLAAWWPLFSPPSEYVEEAADLLPALLAVPDRPPATLLELGSGGGSLACHLKARLTLTLSDRSADMLAVSQKVNPGCEHVLGDMRTLDLGREFDLVLIHDAIMYATDSASVRASLATAYRHCRPGGAALIVPDCVRETFQERTSTGGIDATDGRGLRYLEWTWDPNPRDESFEVALAFILRDPSGAIRSDSDRHRCGLFPRAAWLAWIDEAGFAPSVRVDAWGRDVFTGKKTGRSE
jgi:SAM-dependent methyltransferase